ncbi:MAG TPA: NAD(P)H-hydrate epimerase, partial [Gemmatimonadales bacterium]
MPPIPVLSPAEAGSWDDDAERSGIARETLMESAGRAAATVLAGRFAFALEGGVIVAAGTGNNGGDGWVVARALHRADVPVWVTSVPGERSPLAGR